MSHEGIIELSKSRWSVIAKQLVKLKNERTQNSFGLMMIFSTPSVSELMFQDTRFFWRTQLNCHTQKKLRKSPNVKKHENFTKGNLLEAINGRQCGVVHEYVSYVLIK